MALTQEQQDQLDFTRATHELSDEFFDGPRRNHEIAIEQRRARLEVIRLAKETLIENARSKPVDDRDVSASDITTFANVLNTYINQ